MLLDDDAAVLPNQGKFVYAWFIKVIQTHPSGAKHNLLEPGLKQGSNQPLNPLENSRGKHWCVAVRFSRAW
jgi:hypothetical protein